MATAIRRQDPEQRQVVSYDIMCQYCVNFQKRVTEGGLIDLCDMPKDIDMKVPAWHIGGHIPSCQDEYHLRYTPLVGRTCGELCEPLWSGWNGYKHATREMGHGHRRETLSDVMGDGNWTKSTTEGESGGIKCWQWRTDKSD